MTAASMPNHDASGIAKRRRPIPKSAGRTRADVFVAPATLYTSALA